MVVHTGATSVATLLAVRGMRGEGGRLFVVVVL